jgi:hypothetical protein
MLETYGNNFSFIDYLKAKIDDESFIDYETTNPRTDFKDQSKAGPKKDDSIIKAQVPRRRRKIVELTPEEMSIPQKIREKVNERQKAKDTLKEMNKIEGFEMEKVYREVQREEQIVAPRVSPWAKEDIYKLYLEGWSVRDLAYKYGMMPERVKAIVWVRHQFWKVIYPKIGESGLRQRLEECYEFDKKHGYTDYGIDLAILAEREQGMKINQLDRSDIDVKPPKDVEEKVAGALSKLRGKSIDQVPIGFVGKGAGGYLIKDMVCRRGRGAKRVSEMFKRFMQYKDLNEHLLPRNVAVKKSLGPRLATLGYRF